MTGRTGTGYAEGILEDLKDFQRRTAEYAFERLYKTDNSTRRFLVADEVGRRVGEDPCGRRCHSTGYRLTLTALNTPRTDLIYICSNRAIARQNVERIRHRLSIDTKPLAERITLLPHRLGTLDKPVNHV